MRTGRGGAGDRARDLRRAVEERRGRMRRVSWAVLAEGVVGLVVVDVESSGSETEAMVKGLRRSFSQGFLRREVAGRAR